jgi:hypothetical protein
LDANSNIYTAGIFWETVDFDPGTGINNLTAAGSGDVFVSKLDSNGNFVWAKKMGGATFENGFSIDTDAFGNVFTTGIFQETVDFDPGVGIYNLTSAGFYDVFISKLKTNGDFVWAKSVGGTNWDSGNAIAVDISGNVYTTGFFQETVDFDPGAGVVNLTSSSPAGDGFVLKLTSCPTTYGTDTITSCGSYTWINGNTYTSSTNAPTFIVTLHLTINQPGTSAITETACESFIWTNGNGQTYTENTTVSHTIPNATVNGCDSVITLHLTINNVDNAVNRNGIILTANQSGATYQWIDCDNANFPIPGATTQTFTPTINGNYSVEITLNGCTETSECIAVTTVGLESFLLTDWKIYPNPATDKLFIDTKENRSIQLIDVYGKVLFSTDLMPGNTIVELDKLAPGVYFVFSDSGSFQTFVKQ